MKKLILLAIFLLFTKTAQAGLVSWWKMDEASWNGTANEVVDSYGTNHGTASGGTSCTTVVGIDNRAGSFDGSDDYVAIADSASLNLNPGTWSLWFNSGSTWEDTKGIFVRVQSASDAAIRYGVWSYTGGVLKTFLANGISVTVRTVTYTFLTNTWYHIVQTWDSGKANIYVNGVITDSNYDCVTPAYVAAEMAIGRGTSGYVWGGTIDDVRIYNHALTADEVAHQYFLGSETRIRNATIR